MKMAERAGVRHVKVSGLQNTRSSAKITDL